MIPSSDSAAIILLTIGQNNHQDVNHSIENIVSSVVVTVCGVRRVLDFLGDDFIGFVDVWPLWYTCKTNKLYNVNCK